MLPGGPWQAFLSNSGAEAVEASVKLARVATGRPAILAFRYGYHGRTAQTMALTTAKDVYRGAFEPLPGSVYHTAYPYCYRAAGGAHSPDACTCDWEAELDLTFHQFIYPDRVAAVIIEPVLGEGGYVVPPPGFLPRLREITRQHGILLIADEVQTGFGRTGEMFAVQHWDVEPDILVMAKGIASGLPLSGILARAEVMAVWKPGTHGGTYGGNVVSCAAANATLDVIEEEGLVANARERGDAVPGRAARARRQVPERRRRARARPDGRHRARQARRRRRPDARSGPHQADPGRGPGPQADRPDRRHLRQRHPDHPAAGHHARPRSTWRSASSTTAWPPPGREPQTRPGYRAAMNDPGAEAARARVAALLERSSHIGLQVVVVAPPDERRLLARDRARLAAVTTGRGALLDEAVAAARDQTMRSFARSGFSGTWAATDMAVSVVRASDRAAAAAALEEVVTAAVVEDLVDDETRGVLTSTWHELTSLREIPSPGSLSAFTAPAAGAIRSPIQIVFLTACVVVLFAIALGVGLAIGVRALAVPIVILPIIIVAGLARRRHQPDS